jgi:hypothetical protein
MEKYTVIYEAYKRYIEVEANTKEEAEEKALNGEGKETYRKTIEWEADVY